MSETARDFVILGEEQIPAGAMPRHIAIIMDGNRRWARLNGKSKTGTGRGRRFFPISPSTAGISVLNT